MNLIESAKRYHRSGLTALPAILREKRPSLSSWKQYQTMTIGRAHV